MTTTKPEAKRDDPEQSKRFIDKAREIGAAESEEAAKRAFKKVVSSKPPRRDTDSRD